MGPWDVHLSFLQRHVCPSVHPFPLSHGTVMGFHREGRKWLISANILQYHTEVTIPVIKHAPVIIMLESVSNLFHIFVDNLQWQYSSVIPSVSCSYLYWKESTNSTEDDSSGPLGAPVLCRMTLIP